MGAIDLDPCSNSREIPNVPAAKHYIAQDNGLMQPWVGRVFLNPPFGHDVERCFSKLYLEWSAGRTKEAIVAWKSATETAAWKTLTAISCRVCFPSARIRFVGPSGDDGPGPTFSPALFYEGTRAEVFKKTFAGIGAVWVVPGQNLGSKPNPRTQDVGYRYLVNFELFLKLHVVLKPCLSSGALVF